jgi:hypothetical protein
VLVGDPKRQWRLQKRANNGDESHRGQCNNYTKLKMAARRTCFQKSKRPVFRVVLPLETEKATEVTHADSHNHQLHAGVLFARCLPPAAGGGNETLLIEETRGRDERWQRSTKIRDVCFMKMQTRNGAFGVSPTKPCVGSGPLTTSSRRTDTCF